MSTVARRGDGPETVQCALVRREREKKRVREKERDRERNIKIEKKWR